MSEPPKSWNKHVKESILLFLVGLVSTLLFCWDCLNHLRHTWDDFLYSGLLWVFLWKGNEWLADFPNRYVSWKEQPAKRLFTGIAAHVIYTFVASFALYQIIALIEDGHIQVLNLREIIGNNIVAVIITLIISLFLTARSFLFSWRDLAVEHEKLKAETMASRFASLKAQVNPHFLFNSLNVLSGLVYKDPDLSAQFIKKLAEVYRYVLDRQEEELVPIQDELEFVRSVVFLQRIRFGEHLHIHLDIPEDGPELVPPLAFQMLIENAIKHNVISKEQPLHIHLKKDRDYFVISNDLQPKTIMPDSLGIGLENIRKRYRFLSERPVLIQKKNGTFSVQLPIIEAP